MKTEFYIAKRLSRRDEGNKAGIMERVAVVATAVSIAVIIITLSVVVGFKQDLGKLISGATADVAFTAPQSGGVVSSVGVPRCEAVDALLRDERIERSSCFTTKEGVLKSDDNIVGILLKGVDSLYNTDFYAERIVEGSLPSLCGEPRKKEIMLSERVAKKMDVSVGERIEMVFVDGESGVLRDRFVLSGLYNTGVEFIDNSYAITDIRNVARLYNEDIITGYDVWLKDGVDVELFAEDMDGKMLELYFEEGVNIEAFSMQRIFPHIFGWLATHDVTALVVVVIMLIVALLNMTTSLLIIVMERQRMIGELRALGMRRGSVIRLFVFRALFILGRGLLWGAITGLVLVVIQHLWDVIPLPTEGYLLDAVPTAMCWGWWIVAIAGVVLATLLFMLIPATFSTRISPSVIMRYE
ncbi:MAG: ABC transporter permease [Alistipes sp.]|nr:ABC transporter permease [Alistipes sp.]